MSQRASPQPVYIPAPKTAEVIVVPAKDSPVIAENISSAQPWPAFKYKLEDIEGQKIKEWFKTDLEAKNQIELQPTLKSDKAVFKGKGHIIPRSKKFIEFNEEIEIQANIREREFMLKVNRNEANATFSFGNHRVGLNWFNPYVGVKLPRKSAHSHWLNAFSVGTIFHYFPFSSQGWGRYHANITSNLTHGERAAITIKQNFAYSTRGWTFGALETWDFGTSFDRRSTFSVGYDQRQFGGYAALDIKDPLDFVSVEGGVSYQAHSTAKLFAQARKNLSSEDKPEISLGADFTPGNGSNIKLGYFHDRKLSLSVRTALSKYFSLTLLFDVGLY